MAENRYTIIIVPHTRTNPRKYQISSRFILYAFISLAIVFLVCVGSIVNQVRLYKQNHKLEKIAQENAQLKASLEASKLQTQRLTKRISFLTELSNKLKVMAGLSVSEGSSKRDLSRLGIGGVSIEPGSGKSDRMQQLETQAKNLEKSLVLLKTYFRHKREQLSTTPSILPAPGFISSSFGRRPNPFTDALDFHEGLDITNEPGTVVVATADGTVSYAGKMGTYGQVVRIKHDDSVTTLFAHLAKILVKEGQRVNRREPIGLLGNTGKTTGPHLHYEVHVNNQPVNPQAYILDSPTLSGRGSR